MKWGGNSEMGKVLTSIILLGVSCLIIDSKDNSILADQIGKQQNGIPTLTANGKENEVKLEWAIDILEQDVLWKIDFNNPKDVNLMSGWGEFYGNGNQSLQSEVFIQMVQILADTKYLIQNREGIESYILIQ